MPVWLTAWATDFLVKLLTPIIQKAISDSLAALQISELQKKLDALGAAANQLSQSTNEKDQNEAEDALAKAHNS